MDMKTVLNKDCLVLNGAWTPCNITTVRKAVQKALSGRVKIVHPTTLVPYTFDEWVEKGHEREIGETLIYMRKTYDIPTIICAVYYKDLHIKYTPLNRQNVYKRDGFQCAYCGSKQDLTWDHIVPECEGGKYTWTNLVTCCKNCNNQKDRMSVEEFCQIKDCAIPKPVSLATTPWLVGKVHLRPEWKMFLKGG